MLDHSSQVQRHKLSDRKNDTYETPTVAVEALLRVEKLPHHIWEPACGSGAIVNVLRDHGHTVRATDLVDYGCPESQSRIDFLMEYQQRVDVEAIVTNPPFKLAHQFVSQALFHSPLVVMLLRLAFMESQRRCDILDNGKLARVHVFRKRLPMMHCKEWEGPKANSGMAFAWFVWEREHTGPAELRRLSWENAT